MKHSMTLRTQERISKNETNIVQCVFGGDTFMDFVWTPEYQTQCLHNESAYSLKQLLFVVGSSTIISQVQ